MPLQKCTKDGKSGHRWGKSGKCYTGKDSKKRALKQGYAIDPKKFKEEMNQGHSWGVPVGELTQIMLDDNDDTDAN